MNKNTAQAMLDALLDSDVEHVEYVPPNTQSYGIVVGNFARGQAGREGYTVWGAYGRRVGSFATGQRDPRKRIKVVR